MQDHCRIKEILRAADPQYFDHASAKELRGARRALKCLRQQLLRLSSAQSGGGSFSERFLLGGCDVYPLWYIAGVIAYIKETGDFEILEERRPFSSELPAAAIHIHLRMAYELVYESVRKLDPFVHDRLSSMGNTLAICLFLSIGAEYVKLCRFAELRCEAVFAEIIQKQILRVPLPVRSKTEWLQFARAALHGKAFDGEYSALTQWCGRKEVGRFLRLYLRSLLTNSRYADTDMAPEITVSRLLSAFPAWGWNAVSDRHMGIKADFEGLFIEPGIRKVCKNLNIKRYFRNAIYDICIQNTVYTPSEVRKLVVDGSEYLGNLLPNFSDGNTHRVEVTLGSYD